MQTLRPGRQHQQFLHQLSKQGAQTGCMFSVLKATENYVESHKRKKRRPVFDKYAAVVASYVESYIAANQIYPKISEIVQKTGGKRSTITRILNELNLEKVAGECKEVCVKGRDDMQIAHTIHSPSECMSNDVINSKNSAWPCSDKFDQLAQEVESVQAEASIDSTDAEMVNERIDISAQNLEEKGCSSVLSEPALLTLFDQARQSRRTADANRRVAPLMEVLQLKSSGSSRRVHLSACGGIENDLSWEETLRSIMPTPVNGKEDTSGLKDEQPKVNMENMGHKLSIMPTPVNGKEDASGLKDEQPKVNVENMVHKLTSSEKCNKSSGTASDFNFTVKIVPSKMKSILGNISVEQLQNALKHEAEVFKDLKSIRLFRRLGNTNAYAILQFKNNESMKKALKLKTIAIVGERLFLRKGLAETVDLTRKDFTHPAELCETSVFQEVMQGMAGILKKKDMSSEVLHSPTFLGVEDKKSDVCMEAHPVSHSRFSQTITIQECPVNIPRESIKNFFSVFGKVQTSHGASTLSLIPKEQIFVEFEKESDKEKAMKVQQFAVDGCSFVLRPVLSSLVIQLKCKESGTDLKAVAAACKRYGVVEKVSLRQSQIIDVTFGAIERDRIDELLKSVRGDAYFKEKWNFLPVYDGYIKAEGFQPCHKEKLKNMVVVLNELILQLKGMLPMKG